MNRQDAQAHKNMTVSLCYLMHAIQVMDIIIIIKCVT